ncbi:hypothetical protein DSCO28_18190 [Desulfosarcina ovata subsp. sediminis]|uniref:DUF86 domain-containing protein n=1 Tax=Desulfosarcina ovata subsp. sediminis TaxID=885957 RepID=A0A5K7ZRD6_9BACT|nr:DUF86 domain-containing protein [Desulfosarcina ovata]BBO81253.1 hypothetical protein DSCO28_18190 [Desulfosarcina ovata subsp. sediminis]
MDDPIKDHLKHLNKYYLLLLESRQVAFSEFNSSLLYQGSTERFLQLAIESCINIGNRLLSLYQFTKPVAMPGTYADIFKELGRLGVVDNEFMQRLIKMARFRNRLVHLYWDIDPESIYRFLQENLNDFKLFQQNVIDFLHKNELPPED